MRSCRLLLILLAHAACESTIEPGAGPGPANERDSGAAPLDLTPALVDAQPPVPDGPVLDEAALRARFEELKLLVEAELKQQGVPGAAVGVVLHGTLRLAAGLGVKQKGGTQRPTEHTLFSLGSISKTFTAAAALSLSAKLAPADAASKHVPKLKLTGGAGMPPITIHQLLTHTSGLGYPAYSEYEKATLDWSSPSALVALFEQLAWPQWVAPGAVWNYSNPGFNLVGAAAERAAGKPFDQLLEASVLLPAGMTQTTASVTKVQARDHATGHYGGKTVAPGLSLSAPSDAPCNGVYSSAWEMTRFAELLMSGGGGVLPASAVKAMTQPQVTMSSLSDAHAYGYGLFIQPYRGTVRVGHGGSNMGFTADLAIVPSEGFAVVVLFNSAEGYPSAVSEKALALFLPHLTAQTPPLPQPTPTELQALAGTYLDSFDLGTIEVAFAGGGLTATFKKWKHTTKLIPYARREFGFQVNQAMSDALFLGGWLDFDAAFAVDAAGKGLHLVTRLGVATRTGL